MADDPRRVWLDAFDYCGDLLAAGSPPWLDSTAFVAWQRKSLALLKPDVAALPLAPVIDAWLQRDGALRVSMASRPRTVHPVRTLLADMPLRAHVLDIAAGLRAAATGLPLALVVPSPRSLLEGAYRQAHGTPPATDDDDVDAASVYVADFLRVFGEVGIDLLLLEETVGGPADAVAFELYQSVFNVAANYRWTVGIRLADRIVVHGSWPSSCAFAVASLAQPGVATTWISLEDDFWQGGAAAPPERCFAAVPRRMVPEMVLERLAGLR